MELKKNQSRKLTLGFGKGRLFEETLEKFNFLQNEAFLQFSSGQLPIYSNSARNITCVAARHVDLRWLLEKKYIDVAIGSSLWFQGREDQVVRLGQLVTKPYRLALISESGTRMEDIKRVATRFDKIAVAYFQQKRMDVEIISMEGCHEIAFSLGIADAIIDVIETGATIRKMRLKELESIVELSHDIWVRNDDQYPFIREEVEQLMFSDLEPSLHQDYNFRTKQLKTNENYSCY